MATYYWSITWNTGVNRIYYCTTRSGTYTSITSSTTIITNSTSTLYFYATASTGYAIDSTFPSTKETATSIIGGLPKKPTSVAPTATAKAGIEIIINTGVASVTYSNALGNWTTVTTNTTIPYLLARSFTWYATAELGYAIDSRYPSTQEDAQEESPGATVSPTATAVSTSVMFIFGNNIQSIHFRKNSTGNWITILSSVLINVSNNDTVQWYATPKRWYKGLFTPTSQETAAVFTPIVGIQNRISTGAVAASQWEYTDKNGNTSSGNGIIFTDKNGVSKDVYTF